MKTSELRIGNLVQRKYDQKVLKIIHIKENVRVEYIRSDTGLIHKPIQHFNEIKPIDLREEILLKFGFNKDYQKGYIGIDVCNSDFVLTEPLKMGEWQTSYAFQFETGNVPKFKQIEFVHQLQNLYFALCGEELELK
jgi:hypothetical protein